MAAVSYENKTVILFLGRSGNGKTSCVQTLNDKVNTDLLLVECPDVEDTEEELQKDMDTLLKDTEKLVQYLSSKYGGIVALVFVLKYGVRFTKQEKDAVAVVKYLFGDSVFSDRGIIAFSCGDVFDLDYGDTPGKAERFMDWCREQKGDIEKLFQEVNYRCVLLDNKTKTKEQNYKQVKLISEFVDSIGHQCKPIETLHLIDTLITPDQHKDSDDRGESRVDLYGLITDRCVNIFTYFRTNVIDPGVRLLWSGLFLINLLPRLCPQLSQNGDGPVDTRPENSEDAEYVLLDLTPSSTDTIDVEMLEIGGENVSS
ncbi:AIG protein [Biomphalaria glabrata]|nr:AIG Resistant factor [Biomphalaria glabrata]